MYQRLIKFIEENKIIYQHQFGFQKSKSTSQAILDMSMKIVNAIENNKISCCVFLDFAKAFDTVDHNILIKKLDYYGIRGTALKWFKSYLSDRTQRVSINGELSNDLSIKYGVPQGSVLGPLLFLLYINDIPLSSKVLNFHLFADDTSIFHADKDLNKLESTINKELTSVSDWLIANKLTLNLSKSNFLLIHPRQKTLRRKIELKLNNELIREVEEVKYLGVLIDKHLNWKPQIQNLNTKISKGIGILRKVRHLVPQSVLLKIYNAFILPYITYGLLNWGSATKTALAPLDKKLKKAVRIITFKSTSDHSKPIFKYLNTLNLEDCYKFECAKFMYELSKNRTDSTFSDVFKQAKDIHSFKTRHATSGKLYKPRYRTNYGKDFITNTGVNIWNSIPAKIRQSKSKSSFSKALKKLMISKY